ncbi:MAG: protein phosphatase CheZ [Gammaproteobacteria bacterium]|uniref:protein phosphatase CheZ n=1 Tax=Pseudomaricurvus alcaniphilus TaxID=1166482 RepID=UPI00140A0128|nr:protein phosphatase CheZ [Pseudomaricurvus alcaniphilus]MBR9911649.1 protein phosphatase CheZ [Gammaproteobacteria bacterium]NHN39407.1 protein phosphatase CheZ [Pseudomaricurvus alcaniphilus]
MATNPQLHNNQEFMHELQDCAKQLSQKLNSDDIVGASLLIERLVEVRDRNIFTAVGKLTRALHDAIVNFHVDAGPGSEPVAATNSDMRDASERLNYVIEMTRAAADKTMDKVEASAPIAADLSQRAAMLQQEWLRLQKREMTADEFRQVYRQALEFFADTQTGSTRLNENFQQIILEQGYQDLSGQVLKRVIGLMVEVEENLVELVSIAGSVEEITGLVALADNPVKHRKETGNVKAEGPQIHSKERNDVVSGQDEVDDLLSSLGF